MVPSLVPLLLQPPPTSLVKNIPELGKFAVFDCEWHRDDLIENRQKGIAGDIYAFCLVDSHGTIERLHVNNFTDRRHVDNLRRTVDGPICQMKPAERSMTSLSTILLLTARRVSGSQCRGSHPLR